MVVVFSVFQEVHCWPLHYHSVLWYLILEWNPNYSCTVVQSAALALKRSDLYLERSAAAGWTWSCSPSRLQCKHQDNNEHCILTHWVDFHQLDLILSLMPRTQELGKIELQDSSGGKFHNFIHYIFMARIVQNEILPLNSFWIKLSKFPPLLCSSLILPNSRMRALFYLPN